MDTLVKMIEITVCAMERAAKYGMWEEHMAYGKLFHRYMRWYAHLTSDEAAQDLVSQLGY